MPVAKFFNFSLIPRTYSMENRFNVAQDLESPLSLGQLEHINIRNICKDVMHQKVTTVCVDGMCTRMHT